MAWGNRPLDQGGMWPRSGGIRAWTSPTIDAIAVATDTTVRISAAANSAATTTDVLAMGIVVADTATTDADTNSSFAHNRGTN